MRRVTAGPACHYETADQPRRLTRAAAGKGEILKTGKLCYSLFMCAQGATTAPRGIRVPDSLRQAIEDEAQRLGRSWSATATELLEEAVRVRRAPGIAFIDGATGRRAVIAGTALGV